MQVLLAPRWLRSPVALAAEHGLSYNNRDLQLMQQVELAADHD